MRLAREASSNDLRKVVEEYELFRDTDLYTQWEENVSIRRGKWLVSLQSEHMDFSQTQYTRGLLRGMEYAIMEYRAIFDIAKKRLSEHKDG